MISYIIPTRNRHERLASTLSALGSLSPHDRVGGAEVLVIDNASTTPVQVAPKLSNGLTVRLIRRDSADSASARNLAAREAHDASRWLVMLDDDSHPLSHGHLDAILDARGTMAVIAAEILLPGHTPEQPRREAGGLPEVFIGCGAAIRREAFLKVGGYDEAFDYYAEEYDLTARLLLAGYSIGLDRRFHVMHHKAPEGRNFSRIIRRLVRNNAWVAQRYAPDDQRLGAVHEHLWRYARIAKRERALRGYALGFIETLFSLSRQERDPMSPALFDRFTGLAAARDSVRLEHERAPLGRVALVEEGKNSWAIRQALQESDIQVIDTPADADTLVIATLSPGPMLDAFELWTRQEPKRRIIVPWADILWSRPLSEAKPTTTPDATLMTAA